uniref:Uncharacterized protein n=1 Tax=Mustela putorius furo TaxID=9669 RepID=M3YPV1_MUSPF
MLCQQSRTPSFPRLPFGIKATVVQRSSRAGLPSERAAIVPVAPRCFHRRRGLPRGGPNRLRRKSCAFRRVHPEKAAWSLVAFASPWEELTGAQRRRRRPSRPQVDLLLPPASASWAREGDVRSPR